MQTLKKPAQPEAQEPGAVELCLCLQSKSKSNRIDSPDPGKILSTLEVIALQAEACYLHRLALIKRHACADSQLLACSCANPLA